MSRFSEKRLAQYLAEAVLPKRRGRDATVIIATLALGLLGNFLFSKVEVAALLWLITLIAIGDLVSTFGPLAKLKWLGRVFIIAIVIVLGALSTGPWMYRQYRAQHSALTDGDLTATESFPDIPEGKHVVEMPPGVKWIGDDAQPDPFKFGGDSIHIEKENGQVVVSLIVRDRDGNAIVEITKNKWRVSPSLAWDKNYTSDSIEVLDARGRVVLHTKLLRNGIRLETEIHDEQGGSGRFGGSIANDPGFHRNDAIARWFKYPSKDHWGELTTTGEAVIEQR